MKRISQLTFGHYRRFLYQIKYLDNMPRLPHVQILFRKPNSLSVDNKRKVLKEGYQFRVSQICTKTFLQKEYPKKLFLYA